MSGLASAAGGSNTHAGGHGLGHGRQCPRRGARLALGHGRDADVATLAHGDVERHAAEVLQAVLRGKALSTATAEDLGQLAAVRAGERGHVLDDAEDRHAHPLEHRERLGHVAQRDFLRGRDEDGAADRDGLGQRQLGVRGAGRQVDDEVVELTPLDVAQELLDRAPDQRPAPHDGLTLRDEELDRDRLDAVALERRDLVIRARLGLALDAHHQRDVRAGDVAVQQADAGARLGEGHGEVDADRALADAALARCDGDDVLDARHELLRLAWLGATDHRSPRDLDLLDADAGQDRAGIALDLVLERAGRRRQFDREGDGVTIDDDRLDHVERDDVASKLRFSNT